MTRVTGKDRVEVRVRVRKREMGEGYGERERDEVRVSKRDGGIKVIGLEREGGR